MKNNTSLGRVLALYLLVFVSGAAVMVYEFIAIRILQRVFGSSLEVWSAEISVCLLGLAVGYSLGGWLADRYRAWWPIGVVLCVAGSSACFMEPVVLKTAELMQQGEVMRWWEPLATSAVATLAPLLALGTVMPQAIRLRVTQLDQLGAGAGRIAAVSTVGSICGTLATSSLFVQWGVRESLYFTCATLVIGGVVILAAQGLLRRKAAASALCVATAFAGSLAISPIQAQGLAADVSPLFEDYSSYHHILVRDVDGRRVMYFDSTAQSAMKVDNPYAGGFEYTDFFHTAMLLNPSATSVLFVGLGGGTGPKAFFKAYPAVKIDVAEIDPAVVKVATEYFKVPADPRVRVTATDGRTFIQRTKNRYGAILMDAYASGRNGCYLPYHLATQEFFQAASEKMDDGGVLVYNVMGVYNGQNDKLVRDMLKTLESVFPHVLLFEAESSDNTVYVAQKAVKDGKPWPDGPWADTTGDLAGLVKRLRDSGRAVPEVLETRLKQISAGQAAPRTGTIVTDNNAPVDISQGR